MVALVALISLHYGLIVAAFAALWYWLDRIKAPHWRVNIPATIVVGAGAQFFCLLVLHLPG